MIDTFMKQQRMNHERLSSARKESFISLEYNNDILKSILSLEMNSKIFTEQMTEQSSEQNG